MSRPGASRRELGRPVSWRASLTAAIVLAAAALAGSTPGAAAGASGATCSQRVPATVARRPVVFVHGWNSSAAGMEGVSAAVNRAAPGVYFTFCFDYANLSARWPSTPGIHQKLADAIVALSAAYKRGGGDGRVLAAGHSMGGIALRFASADSSGGVAVASVLAGVVTLGTPHQGSPWGATGVGRLLEAAVNNLHHGAVLPPADSDAQACLASLDRVPSHCGVTPYLPQGVPLTELGTQIVVHRSLFNIGFIKGPSTDIPVFGDGLVPQNSSNGYIGSGPGRGRIPYRSPVDPAVIGCSYSTDYLLAAKGGAQLASDGGPLLSAIGALTGVLINEKLDSTAQDRILAGKASPALVELTAYAATTPCFHTSLTTQSDVVAAMVAAFAKEAAASAPVSDSSVPCPTQAQLQVIAHTDDPAHAHDFVSTVNEPFCMQGWGFGQYVTSDNAAEFAVNFHVRDGTWHVASSGPFRQACLENPIADVIAFSGCMNLDGSDVHPPEAALVGMWAAMRVRGVAGLDAQVGWLADSASVGDCVVPDPQPEHFRWTRDPTCSPQGSGGYPPKRILNVTHTAAATRTCQFVLATTRADTTLCI